MPKVVKRTYSLTAEQAAFIDRKVASGEYASGSEVVRSGLRNMQAEDAVIEKWLREEVAPVYDAWKVNPQGGQTAEEVLEDVTAHLKERSLKKAS
jgi:antitoxin ParD1/3/4